MVTVSPGLACGQSIFRLEVGEQKSSTSVVVGGNEAVDLCRNRLERLVLVAKVDVVTESVASTSRVEDFFASYRVDPLVSCEAVSRNSVDMRLSGGKTGLSSLHRNWTSRYFGVKLQGSPNFLLVAGIPQIPTLPSHL